MNRLLVLSGVLLLAVSLEAAPRRRSVAHPSVPKQVTAWTLEIMTAGGIAPSIRTGVVLQSTGAAALVNDAGLPVCAAAMKPADLESLGNVVANAQPESWERSYGEDGCCDLIRTSVKLTRTLLGEQPVAFETVWFDGHGPLPAGLTALYEAAHGHDSLRARFDPSCFGNTLPDSWSLELTNEGGVAYRHHRIEVDSFGNVAVQPNLRDPECRSTIDAGDTQSLGALVKNANAAAWAPSYVRPENPDGCCDQIHTTVRLTRNEAGHAVTYVTHWYSDHPTLPADLETLGERLTPLFQRFGPACGPIF